MVAASVGVSLPARVVSNTEVGALIGVEDEWIVRRTGIHSRRIAGPTERLDDHAARASRQALARAGVDPLNVDLVIVGTTTSDELMPAAAPLVAHKIGATRAGAFDVGSACTGFLSALAVATAQIEAALIAPPTRTRPISDTSSPSVRPQAAGAREALLAMPEALRGGGCDGAPAAGIGERSGGPAASTST